MPYSDNKKAIFAYLQFYCDETILGKIDSEYAVHILNGICETINLSQEFIDVYHPAMAIWYYFVDDLYFISIGESAIFNKDLNNLNRVNYILKVIHQFQYMLNLNLPKDFMSFVVRTENLEWNMRDYVGRALYFKEIGNIY